MEPNVLISQGGNSTLWESSRVASNRRKCCVAVVTAVVLLVIAALVITAIYLAKGSNQAVFSNKAVVAGVVVGVTILFLGFTTLFICRRRCESTRMHLSSVEEKHSSGTVVPLQGGKKEKLEQIREEKIYLHQLAEFDQTDFSEEIKTVVSRVGLRLDIMHFSTYIKAIYGENPGGYVVAKWKDGELQSELLKEQLTILLSSDDRLLSTPLSEIQKYSPEQREVLFYRLAQLNTPEKQKWVSRQFFPEHTLGDFRQLVPSDLVRYAQQKPEASNLLPFITSDQLQGVFRLFGKEEIAPFLPFILPTRTEFERQYTASIMSQVEIGFINEHLDWFSGAQLRCCSLKPFEDDGFWYYLQKQKQHPQKWNELLDLSPDKEGLTEDILRSIPVDTIPYHMEQFSAEHIRRFSDKQLQSDELWEALSQNLIKAQAVFSQKAEDLERSQEIEALLTPTQKSYFPFLQSPVIMPVSEIKKETQEEIREEQIHLFQLATSSLSPSHATMPVIAQVAKELDIKSFLLHIVNIYGKNPEGYAIAKWKEGKFQAQSLKEQLIILLSPDEQLLSIPLSEIQKYSPEQKEALFCRLACMNTEEKEDWVQKEQFASGTLGSLRQLPATRLKDEAYLPIEQRGLLAFASHRQVYKIMAILKPNEKAILCPYILPTQTQLECRYSRTTMVDLPIITINLNLEYFSSAQLRLCPAKQLDMEFWLRLKKDPQKMAAVLDLSPDKKEVTRDLLREIPSQFTIPVLVDQLSGEHIRCFTKGQFQSDDFPWEAIAQDQIKAESVFSTEPKDLARSKEIWSFLTEKQKDYFAFLKLPF